MESFNLLLSSSVLAGGLTAFVTLQISARKVRIENVTQERAKWRDTMRKLAEALINATQTSNTVSIISICSQLALNVNPSDPEDIALIQAAEKLLTVESKEAQIKEFIDRMALLLKHDWERAKFEARSLICRRNEPKRITYEEFRNMLSSVQHTSQPSRSCSLFLNFAGLSFGFAVLFFFAVGLTEPFQELVKEFNDSNATKPINAWVMFICVAVISSFAWTGMYIWVKCFEKKVIENLFANKN